MSTEVEKIGKSTRIARAQSKGYVQLIYMHKIASMLNKEI